MVSLALSVTMIAAVLALRHAVDLHNAAQAGPGKLPGLGSPMADRVSQVLLVIAVALGALAAINTILIAWATVLDARQPTALTRALGATPRQISIGLATAQLARPWPPH